MQNELRKIVTDFKQQVANGYVDYDDYNKFLKTYGAYIDVEKPSFG